MRVDGSSPEPDLNSAGQAANIPQRKDILQATVPSVSFPSSWRAAAALVGIGGQRIGRLRRSRPPHDLGLVRHKPPVNGRAFHPCSSRLFGPECLDR
jgi:hypothetical protein